MTEFDGRDNLLELYIFETSQLVGELEMDIISCEKQGCYSPAAIDGIFRCMHTIKGSSSMMQFANIAALAHVVEDLFQVLREKKPVNVVYTTISDYVLEAVDFIKTELDKIRVEAICDGNPSDLIESITKTISVLKGGNINNCTAATGVKVTYRALVHFEEECGMENIRAFGCVSSMMEFAEQIVYNPGDLDDLAVSEEIRQKGFEILFKTDLTYGEVQEILMRTPFVESVDLLCMEPAEASPEYGRPEAENDKKKDEKPEKPGKPVPTEMTGKPARQEIISVSVSKLDILMDLVGELVITEAIVTQNPDLKGLELESFSKSARQLRKITEELQNIAMSIRMVPLASTFHKMHRVVRDMVHKCGKEVDFMTSGEETEVDRKIIEHLSDPIMHMIRNAIDHGIEPPEERLRKGKSGKGRVVLEARHLGGDVIVTLRDDGRGLNRTKILEKARTNGLLTRPETEMADRDVYNLIFLPGFSTKEEITEFSGRGVGMDVVTRNMQAIGGTVTVESHKEQGTTILLQIPPSLAIIDGMNLKVGNTRYTVSTSSIKETFRLEKRQIITDPSGNEMILLRGKCHTLLRLHERFGIKTGVQDLEQGIAVMVENKIHSLCLFADELLGQQQVVVKPLPGYIAEKAKSSGIAGCTLLGDGNISLILDVSALSVWKSENRFDQYKERNDI